MKPILIDSLYVNSGGGLSILRYIVRSAAEIGIDFVLIRDNRCPKLDGEEKARNVVVMAPSMKVRHQYYKAHKDEFRTVFCFGNIPPSIKMPCNVHTYFHNLSVLYPPRTYSCKRKFLFFLKRTLINFLTKNTDSWVVQTSNTENLLRKSFGERGKTFHQLPVYTIPKTFLNINCSDRKEYLFIGDYTYSKGHDILLEAWKKLHKMGHDYVLNLTINRRPATEAFYMKMEDAIADGVSIVNHGVIPFEKVVELYGRSKAVIYPSQLESLGLGIVEGLHAGCDIIASDLPFTHSICKPSEVFDALNPDSIVEAVLRYEKGQSEKSVLTIHDCITELVKLISE